MWNRMTDKKLFDSERILIFVSLVVVAEISAYPTVQSLSRWIVKSFEIASFITSIPVGAVTEQFPTYLTGYWLYGSGS